MDINYRVQDFHTHSLSWRWRTSSSSQWREPIESKIGSPISTLIPSSLAISIYTEVTSLTTINLNVIHFSSSTILRHPELFTLIFLARSLSITDVPFNHLMSM